MPLTHTTDLFAKALKGKYALGAFNVNNMELLQAIIEACEEEKAPVMLQISKGARQYANPVYLKKLIEAAVSGCGIAMGRLPLVQRYLDSGILIAPLGNTAIETGAWYVVLSDEARMALRQREFLQWLQSELATSQN